MPLTAGMDQGPDELMGPLGNLKRVRNMRAVSGGFLRKRVGFTTFSGATPAFSYPLVSSSIRETPTMLAKIGNANLVGISSGAIFALDETDGGTTFKYAGRHSTCTPLKSRAAFIGGDLTGSSQGFGRSPSGAAICSTGYVMVCAVTDGGELHVFIENQDGVRISRSVITSVVKAQCLAVADSLVCIYQTATDIRANVVTPSSASDSPIGAGSSFTSIATLTGASAYWDTSAYDGTNWYLVYQNGAAQCTVARMAGETVAATRTFSVTGTVPLSITAMPSMAAANAVWVGYYDDPTVSGTCGYLVMSASLGATTLGKTTIASAVNELGPPLFGPFRDRRRTDADAAFYVARQVLTPFSAGATDSTRVGIRDALGNELGVGSGAAIHHMIPVSKPDARQRFWVMLSSAANSNSVFQQFYLLRVDGGFFEVGVPTNGRPVIELASRIQPAMGSTYGPVAKLDYFHAIATGDGAADATSRALYPLPTALTTVSGVPLASIELYEYATSEFSSHRDTQEASQGLLMSGQPAELYGQTINTLNGVQYGDLGAAEIGWPHAPVVVGDSQAAGNVDAGTHSYKFFFEWSDVYGRRHRSAPSAPYSVTLTTARQVTLTISDASLTQRQFTISNVSPPILIAYRTLVGGVSYKRLPGSTVALSATYSGKVTFVDNSTDASIAGNETIYTDGGVFPNVLAPSCQFFTKSEDRVWVGGLWDPTVIECSKILVPEEQVAFTGDPSFQVPLFAPCTGLAYMDGAVVAFTRDSVVIITGEGPNDQGQGGFSTRYLTKELGCVNYRTIIETNVGIVFQSADGYYLLPRGFGPPQAIGNAVRKETHSGAAQRCLSAAAVTSEQTQGDAGGSTYAVWLTDRGESARWGDVASGATTASAGAVTNPTGIAAATISHTLVAGFSRMVLVLAGVEVGSGFGYVPGSATATYGGVSMTLVHEYTPVLNPTTVAVLVFGLLEEDLPAPGVNAVAVRITTSGTPSGSTQGVSVGVQAYENVRQAFPATFTETLLNSVTTVSQSVAIPLGGIGVDVVLCTGGNGTKTADSGQTTLLNFSTIGHFGVSDEVSDGSGSQAMGWSFTNTQTTLLHVAFFLEGVLSSLLVWDTESGQWFTDELTDRMAEIGAWSDGLALVTEDLDSDTEDAPIRYMNDVTKTTEDGATYISARVETSLYHPFGLVGWGTVKQVAVSFVGSGFDLHCDVRVNGGDWQLSSWTIAAGEDGVVQYRYVTPEVQKCSTFELRIYDTEDEADDVSFGLLGVALELDDSNGLRLVDEGERA
jgi:hypothetical protein